MILIRICTINEQFSASEPLIEPAEVHSALQTNSGAKQLGEHLLYESRGA